MLQRAQLLRLLALLLFLPAPAPSQPIVRSVTVQGNSALGTREVLGWVSTVAGKPLSDQALHTDVRTVTEVYRQNGYFDVRVSAEHESDGDATRVDVRIMVMEGPQTRVGTVTIAGNTVFTADELTALLDTRAGTVPGLRTLERDMDAIVQRYERAGHAFVQCAVASMQSREGPDGTQLDITLAIDEGPRVTIDELQVSGNTETRDEVIVREMRIGVGETFDPVKIDAIRPRLRRLNIFADVAEPELYMRGGATGIKVSVSEGRTNTFDGVVGYVPPTTVGESGYLTGLASVSMRNLFGTGRRLAFRWQREDRFSQELGLRYLEPWVLGYPANLGGGYAQRKQDTSYVRTMFDAKAELMLTDKLSLGLLFGADGIVPSATVASGRVFRSSTITIGGEVQYDVRDDLYSPTSGARYRTDYQYGRKRIIGVPEALLPFVETDPTVQKIGLDLEFYLSVVNRQVLAVGVHGRDVRSGHVEEGDLFRFGGARSLRGYRENQFVGSRVVWSNVEYRLLLARRSFLYGFFDSGYYVRPADPLRSIEQADAFKTGYGLGVQLETALGTLGVSFALGEGDSFSTGKVHFGLINEF